MSLINSLELRRMAQSSYSTQQTQQPVHYDKMYRASSTNGTAQGPAPLSQLSSSNSPSSVVLQTIAELLRGAGGLTQPPQLIESQSKNPFILSAIPTAEVAGQLHQAGLANTFNENWQALVADAAQKNGGFGNAQEGFLAFSEIGFVRFNNPNLSEQQNKRLAEISLDSGFQIEKMPSRADSSGEKISQWADKFINEYDTQMAKFVEDPSQGFAVKDGRKRFEMKVDPASGEIISHHYKKSGGLKGLMQRMYKYIAPVADAVSMVGSMIPGYGTAVAAIAQGVKSAAGAIATGGKMAKQFLGGLATSAAALIPGGSTLGSIAQSALATAGNYLTTGKLKLQDLIFTSLSGLQGNIPSTGYEFLDKVINNGVAYGIGVTDKNNPNPPSFIDYLRSLFAKEEEKKPADVTTKPAPAINADDPLLEGLSQPIEGATILT